MSTRLGLLVMLASSATLAQNPQPTASQVIERIKQHVGVPWREPTVDTFKCGDPETQVTGIAVTMMATLDVLRQAAAKGCNLIITHEPTFYGHLDATEPLVAEHDPVFKAKFDFLEEHHLVVWRFHDHWHQRNPDGIHMGMVRALGWEKYHDAKDPFVFTLPPTTLKSLASTIKGRLGIHVIRVVGDSTARVSTLGICEGFPGFDSNRRTFQRKGVEVLVIGEAHEWETIEYAADAIAAGQKKGLVVLGHIPSEQAGMEECARWLKTFVTEVPIEFVPTNEPFWTTE